MRFRRHIHFTTFDDPLVAPNTTTESLCGEKRSDTKLVEKDEATDLDGVGRAGDSGACGGKISKSVSVPYHAGTASTL